MNKEEFKVRLLQLLKDAGYNTEGISHLEILCDIEGVPEINVSYFKI